ncbi:MAG TPA: sulfite exporter TauE/SafE family protein [Clostridia bacterium]|nr:sulfite exporter TauE/SafE family protein [Clostridia bacterium]
MNNLILGLSSGIACLSYCVPVILPFYLARGNRVGKNFSDLLLFMSGRLAGYLLFGIAAFFTGRFLLENNPYRGYLLGGTYIIFSIFLILEFFRKRTCTARKLEAVRGKLKVRGLLFPLLLGFLTGINLCPTFMLAFTEASSMNNLLECLWFFFLFFVGTTVYFVPIPLLGLLRNREGVRIVGRFLLVLVGIWFIYKGIMLILASGGII